MIFIFFGQPACEGRLAFYRGVEKWYLGRPHVRCQNAGSIPASATSLGGLYRFIVRRKALADYGAKIWRRC